jgi:hypothetical protein
VKNRSRIAIFIFLFFFLSNVISYDHLIATRSPSGLIHKAVPNNTPTVSSLGDQYFLTSDLTNMTLSSTPCNDSSPNSTALVCPSNEIISTQATTDGMSANADYPISQYIFNTCQDVIGIRMDWLNTEVQCFNSNGHQSLENYYIRNVDNINPQKIFDSGKYLELGPNIGALAAVGTDTTILNGTIAGPQSNITRNTFYDVRGVNIGALAAVAADKALIDATITQLNGSAITIQIAKNTIHAGDNQSITITVADKLTDKGLEKASIDGWISNSSGISYIFFSGLTNNSGIMSSSWHVPNGTTPGKVTIVVEAYHKGYQKSSKSDSFLITS